MSITDGNGGLKRGRRKRRRLIDVTMTSITDSFASSHQKKKKKKPLKHRNQERWRSSERKGEGDVSSNGRWKCTQTKQGFKATKSASDRFYLLDNLIKYTSHAASRAKRKKSSRCNSVSLSILGSMAVNILCHQLIMSVL